MFEVSFAHQSSRGPEGHAIVAEIAEIRLTDVAKNQIAQLLAADDSHAKHLDGIASWADAVRPARPETEKWHFVDIPLDAPKYDASRDLLRERLMGKCRFHTAVPEHVEHHISGRALQGIMRHGASAR